MVNKPPLSIEQILTWADDHFSRTGHWPKVTSGEVAGTEEKWININRALPTGGRGLPGGSTLARLLAKHRGMPHRYNRPPITIEQVLAWADDHFNRTGACPTPKSGEIPSTDETWSVVDSALHHGNRGLPGGGSLASLLAKYGRKRPYSGPALTIEQILAWADEHLWRTLRWPIACPERIAGTNETWQRVNIALRSGVRGLPGGSSLAKLLAERRGKTPGRQRPVLTVAQILAWADEHHELTGKWPTENMDEIPGTDEKWRNINSALRAGRRGLPGGSSLPKLLSEHRGESHRRESPPLAIEEILTWADEHFARTGEWPRRQSGSISGTNETWKNVNQALYAGGRGLPGGSSLPRLLAEHRGVRHVQELPHLTGEQILEWVDDYIEQTGCRPNSKSGGIRGTGETWAGVQSVLYAGGRGLPGGSSLAQFISKHRGKTPAQRRGPLPVSQILGWADDHFKRTGRWPDPQSGSIPGTNEKWGGIEVALRNGARQLPVTPSSLAAFLARHRVKGTRRRRTTLTIPQILAWADAHLERTGSWATRSSGEIHGTEEKWANVDRALSKGGRGLPGGSSLARLLTKHRGKPHGNRKSPLTISQVLAWANAHFAHTGSWPTKRSGRIRGTVETWGAIDHAMQNGYREFPGRYSLGSLLSAHRRARGLPLKKRGSHESSTS